MLSLLLVGVASASYPMFHYDQQRTGYVPEEGPQTNAILWVAENGPTVRRRCITESLHPDLAGYELR